MSAFDSKGLKTEVCQPLTEWQLKNRLLYALAPYTDYSEVKREVEYCESWLKVKGRVSAATALAS